MTDPPGSTVGSPEGFPIWVPSGQTPLTPLRAWFVAQANSLVAALQQEQTRRRSTIVFTDKVTAPNANWSISLQRFTIVGETIAEFQVQVKRENSDLVIDQTGQFNNEIVASLPASLSPVREAPLSSGSTGRVFLGSIAVGGDVFVTSAGNGDNLPKGQVIQLEGMFPLASYYDSMQGT